MPEGKEEWNAAFGGERDELGYDGLQTTDGESVFAGTTYSYGAEDADVVLIKANPKREISSTH